MLVVEVLSPTDGWPKMTWRIARIRRQGVGLVWLVDPENRTVMVCRARQLPQILEGEGDLVYTDFLPGFHTRVTEHFRLPGEELPPSDP